MTDTTERRIGLRVRKLADREAGPGAFRHTDHITGEPSKHPLLGVVFLDHLEHRTDEPQRKITVPTDYATRESWIEMVGVRAVAKPGGPKNNPWATIHSFLHCDQLVLHMLDGDYTYRVVRQPDKYDSSGAPTDAVADSTTEVYWAYDADLIEGI